MFFSTRNFFIVCPKVPGSGSFCPNLDPIPTNPDPPALGELVYNTRGQLLRISGQWMVVDNGCPETAAATAIAPLPPPPAPLYICYESSRDEYGSDADFHHPASHQPQRPKTRELTPDRFLGQLSWRRGSGGSRICAVMEAAKGEKIPAVQAGAALAGSAAS
jgi:hypothetical protein